MTIDYEANPDQLDGDRMQELSIAIAETVNLKEQIKSAKAVLKDIESKYKQNVEEFIPSMLQEIGMKRVDMEDGSSVAIRDVVKATLPTDTQIMTEKDIDKQIDMKRRKVAGLEWIKDSDGDAIIKNKLTVELGKASSNAAKELQAYAEKLGLIAIISEEVHPQTLGAYVKEKVTSGETVPYNELGFHIGVQAVISQPKQ